MNSSTKLILSRDLKYQSTYHLLSDLYIRNQIKAYYFLDNDANII